MVVDKVLLVPDKSKLNIKKTRELLDRWMLLRYGFSDAQIHYTRIQPCIIAEELLVNSDNEEKRYGRLQSMVLKWKG